MEHLIINKSKQHMKWSCGEIKRKYANILINKYVWFPVPFGGSGGFFNRILGRTGYLDFPNAMISHGIS